LREIRSFSSAATIRAHIIHDCVWRAQAAAEVAARSIDANSQARALAPRPATGTRPAGTCHLHQVGRQAQMTHLKYYPKAQIRQGADRDRTLRVDHLPPQTRIASIIVTAHAAPKIATNNKSPCDNARPQPKAASTASATSSRKRGFIPCSFISHLF